MANIFNSHQDAKTKSETKKNPSRQSKKIVTPNVDVRNESLPSGSNSNTFYHKEKTIYQTKQTILKTKKKKKERKKEAYVYVPDKTGCRLFSSTVNPSKIASLVVSLATASLVVKR